MEDLLKTKWIGVRKKCYAVLSIFLPSTETSSKFLVRGIEKLEQIMEKFNCFFFLFKA